MFGFPQPGFPMGAPGFGMPMGAPMGMPMGGMGMPMGAPMGHPMGAPMGAPMGHPGAPMNYGVPQGYSTVTPAGFPHSTSFHGQPIPGHPAYGQRPVSYAPAPPMQAAPPQHAQYAQHAQPIQHAQPPPPEEEAGPSVTISGREGVNDVANGVYQQCGEHGGRYCFTAPTNEGPIYLYFDEPTDNWCIGEAIGSQSYYAVCGPAGSTAEHAGADMQQVWRIWNGASWEEDPKMVATIQ